MKQHPVVLLGSTGTIGISALDVLSRHKEAYPILALSGWRQLDVLLKQCLAHHPTYAVVESAASARYLAEALSRVHCKTIVLHGSAALLDMVKLPEADYIIAAIVGAAGLPAVLAAAYAGKKILLANKESLVISGHLVYKAIKERAGQLLPIDSEHSAILQALPADFNGDLCAAGVDKLVLTASGGPFRLFSEQAMRNATPEEACAHPTWSMGKKISVDSATLMNKGLEIIEACWLFHAQADQIEVVIHPESVLHAMVQYQDGSALAQMGLPDMRTAIACALSWPHRIASGVAPLSLTQLSVLHFEAPDLKRFPCLQLALDALRMAGDAPAILNAANEVAVAAFLDMHIPFGDIPIIIDHTLTRLAHRPVSQDLAALLSCDQEARRVAQQEVARR